MADTTQQNDDPHQQLREYLMEQVEGDQYPSSTMLDELESMLRPEDAQAYTDLLMAKIRQDKYPSQALIRRLYLANE